MYKKPLKTYGREQPRIYTEVQCPVDMDRLCRLCAEPCTTATSISLQKCSQALVSQLLLYFGVLIGENDGMPTKLCMSCKKELDRWEEIKSTVQRGQAYLTQQLMLIREQEQSEQVEEFQTIDDEPESPHEEIQIEEIFEDPRYPDDVTIYDVDDSPCSHEDDASLDHDSSMSNGEFYCNICSINISGKERFQNHFAISHPGKVKTMKTKRAETLMDVYNRLKRPITPTNPFKCGLCSSEFIKSIDLEVHVKEHATTNEYVKRYPCAHCNVLFKQVKLLIQHQKKHIKDPTKVLAATCEICNKAFAKRENLKTHMVSHEEYFRFNCDECPAKFKYNNLLKEHVGKFHRDVPLAPLVKKRAKKVKKTKSSKESLDDKSSIEPLNLELEASQSTEQPDEMETQTSEIVIGKCGLCEMVFLSTSNLTKHLLSIHKPTASEYKEYNCGNCQEMFDSFDALITHVKTHSTPPDLTLTNNGDVKYNCKFCDPPVQLNALLGVEFHMRRRHPNVKYRKELQKVRSSTKPYSETIKQEEDGESIFGVNYDDNSSSEDETTELVVNLVEDAPPDMTKLFYCNICGQDCISLDLYLSHMSQEMDQRTSVPCAACNFKFKKLESLSLHIQKHVDKPFEHVYVACDICGKRFLDEEKLKTHRCIHNHKKFHCLACNIGYTYKIAYINHFRITHTDFQGEPNDLLFELPESVGPQADGIIVNPETLAYILQRSEKNKAIENYGCGVCSSKFDTEYEFESHMIAEFDKLKRRNLPCYICGSYFRKVETLIKHTRKHISNPHKDINHKCNICWKTFHTRLNYTQHMQTHSGNKRFSCNLCDMRFSFKSAWKDHTKSKHPDFVGDESTGLTIAPLKSNNTYDSQMSSQNLQVIQINPFDLDTDATDVEQLNKLIDIAFVDKLDTTTNHEDEVTNELKMLETEPRYKCDICNQKFVNCKLSYEHTLEKHVNTEDELVCPYCQQNHTSKTEFHNHIYVKHSKIRKFFCPICDKDFKQSTAVRIHLNVHSSVRSFQCEQCPNSYRNHSALWQHRKRVHLNEYNIMCELCSKMFITKAELRKHMKRRHEGGTPKPYACNNCSATFELPSKLQQHMNRHTGNLPLRCVKCNAGFVDLKYWRLHMRRVCKVPEEDIPYTRPRFEN